MFRWLVRWSPWASLAWPSPSGTSSSSLPSGRGRHSKSAFDKFCPSQVERSRRKYRFLQPLSNIYNGNFSTILAGEGPPPTWNLSIPKNYKLQQKKIARFSYYCRYSLLCIIVFNANLKKRVCLDYVLFLLIFIANTYESSLNAEDYSDVPL